MFSTNLANTTIINNISLDDITEQSFENSSVIKGKTRYGDEDYISILMIGNGQTLYAQTFVVTGETTVKPYSVTGIRPIMKFQYDIQKNRILYSQIQQIILGGTCDIYTPYEVQPVSLKLG